MELELLLKVIVALVVLLFILIFLVILPARKRKKQKELQEKEAKKKKDQPKPTPKKPEFDELRAIIRRGSSTTEDLEKAVDDIIKYYVHIKPKLGIRPHPEFDKYVDVIMHLVRHKNTNKTLVLKLDRALLKNNPNYANEINETLRKALNSRAFRKSSS